MKNTAPKTVAILSSEELEALRRVIAYRWHDAAENFKSLPREEKSEHIFRDLCRLENLIARGTYNPIEKE